MKITPLQTFLRALDHEQKEQFAQAVGTTRVYLHQLASAEHPNPRLRLALALVEESKKLSRKVMSPPLSLPDLLTGTSDDDWQPTERSAPGSD